MMKSRTIFFRQSTMISFIIVLLLFFMFPFISKAQFAYIGAGVEYSRTIYQKSLYSSTSTTHGVLAANFGIQYRPLKWLGVGFSISKPVYQNSKFSFESDDAYDFNDFNSIDLDYDYHYEARYVPEVYDYSISQGNFSTLFGRLYMGGEFYTEFSLSKGVITEHFQFKRTSLPALYDTDPESYHYGEMLAAPVEKLEFDINEDHNVSIPGLTFGILHHSNKHFYWDLWGGVKLLSFDSPTFTKIIEYAWDDFENETKTVEMKSKFEGKKLSYNFGFRIGYLI